MLIAAMTLAVAFYLMGIALTVALSWERMKGQRAASVALGLVWFAIPPWIVSILITDYIINWLASRGAEGQW